MSLSRLFLLSFFPHFSIFANISLRTVFGILGNITAFGFYASAAITINKIRIKRTVEDSQPYSYLAALMNCMICFVYGLPVVHPNNMPLLIINGVGFLLEVVYIAIFCQYSPYDLCHKIFKILALELVIVICVLASVLGGPYTPGVEKIIDHVLGILFIICGILMYGSHVIIIKEVFRTKSVEHMPLATTVIGLFNAIFWTAYSLLSSDIYILVPNAMGIIFSAFPFIVFLCFKFCCTSMTPKDLESPEGTTILSDCAPKLASVEEGEGTERERERSSAVLLAAVACFSSFLYDHRPLEQGRNVGSPLSSPLPLHSHSFPLMKEFLAPSEAQP